MVDTFFDQPIKYQIKTYENLQKLLLVKEMIRLLFFFNYHYFKEYYKMMALD